MTLIPEAMDAMADKTPDAPVLRFSKSTLTYESLAHRSDQIAAVLIDQGVRPGDRVGLYFKKSIESVIALYGIMKAGAAYVPLDVGAPAARILDMIRQCGLRVLISHPPKTRDLAAIIEQDEDSISLDCVIGIDDPLDRVSTTLSWTDISQASAVPRPTLGGDNLAYILFTSGSTGQPKGIMHTHRSGLAYANFAADMYEVGPGDRLSNHPPLHFDMSLFDFISGPIRGACTVIIPEPYTKLPASLSTLIENERLTHWYSVPFALSQLLQHGALDQRDLSTLRWIVFAGEPFVAKHLKALMACLPQARFSNSYGPTELNQCTYHHVQPGDLIDDRPPPIGRVWGGTDYLVVDENDRDVEPGRQGELLVRSPTMMSGYWGRPDLNEKVFHTPPSTIDAKKLAASAEPFYRTGDLVLDEGDGVLRFLGRKDRQIKLRGFRIELDEVEAALARHPAVADVAAILAKNEHEQSAIVAALTLKPGFDRNIADDVLKMAADRLPAYALPERVDVVDSLPRTASDKIDRLALARIIATPFMTEGPRA